MKWNIAPECTSLVILGIIWVYSHKGSHLPTLKNIIFQGCLVVTFSAMLTNIISTLMLEKFLQTPYWITWSVTTIYYILTPLMGLAYYMYVVSVIHTEQPQFKKNIVIGIIPGLIYTVLVLANPFTKSLFDISRETGYCRGPLISLTYIVFYAYCIACIAITVKNRKTLDQKIYYILSAFPILAMIVIIVQQIYSDVILSGSAATCALLIIYLHLQNRQISMDYLTNVPNRQELLSMLGLMLKNSSEKRFTLVVVSIREFRHINNACGQRTGDEFLKQICRYLCEVGPIDHVYRFNGDEFALLFNHQSNDEIRKCVMAVKKRMTQPWYAYEYQHILTAVMGVFVHSDKTETLENIVNAIEYAVFQAKSGKYGQTCLCDKEMMDRLERRRRIGQILKEKLENKSFEMFYQPIFSVETGGFDYGESLMRIPDSPIGPIYPSEFIPIAEETGIIVDITYAVLEKVCRFIRTLSDKGISMDSIHVNFSAAQFSVPNLKEKILGIINQSQIPPSAIKIEFTETTLAESSEIVTEFAVEMERHGIKMGLDDFGTGYSNIATVINIPFGTIKLDKSLVWASMDNNNSARTIKNLVQIFKQMGMKVVAEGVETEEHRQLVLDFGVDQIQGFYYSKPLSETEMVKFLEKHSKKNKQHRSLS